MEPQPLMLNFNFTPQWRIPDMAKDAKDYHDKLETELQKLEHFDNELPLTVVLLADAVERLKEEVGRTENVPVRRRMLLCDLNETPPMGSEVTVSDKKTWLKSVQLWCSDHLETNKAPEAGEDKAGGSGVKAVREDLDMNKPVFSTPTVSLKLVTSEPVHALKIREEGEKVREALKIRDGKVREALREALKTRDGGVREALKIRDGGYQVREAMKIRDEGDKVREALKIRDGGVRESLKTRDGGGKDREGLKIRDGGVREALKIRDRGDKFKGKNTFVPIMPDQFHPRYQIPLPALDSDGKKPRRCWSPELHRRFIDALDMLGGSQVATPKQIKDQMQIIGLTNDEVKSHLQKYRLHLRRFPELRANPAMAKMFSCHDIIMNTEASGSGGGGGVRAPIVAMEAEAEASHSGSSQGSLPMFAMLPINCNSTAASRCQSTERIGEDKSDSQSWGGV